jgi:long-chain fatty acid transport protein
LKWERKPTYSNRLTQWRFSRPWIVGFTVRENNPNMIHRDFPESSNGGCSVAKKFAQTACLGTLAILIVFVGICAASPVLAQVPRIYGQDAAASGMGNAFAAQADSPSALHYNPAGMTQLRGVQALAGGTFVGGTSEFRSPTGISVTGDRDGAFAWPGPGHAYLTANLQDLGISSLKKLTVGVGITTPFGSVMRWPETGPFNRITTFSALPLFDIKPTVAYQLVPNLSIGAGADIYTFASFFGEGHAELQSVSPAGSKVELNGRGTAPGFNLGALYTALRNSDGQPIANLAVVYRSQATLHLDGALLVDGIKIQDATTTFVLPQVITGGVALWPIRDVNREWKLELNVDYVGWKSVRNLDIRLADGTVIPQPQDWRSTYAILAGTEYRWLKINRLPGWEIAIRGGYTNQQTQVPDLTFSPSIPSADSHVISSGIGLICQGNGSLLGLIPCGSFGIGPVRTKLVGADISYQAFLLEPRTISGNTGPRATVNGFYRSTVHAGGFSIRASF